MNVNPKVRSDHLCRCAYLYVRQSTMRQVIENTESSERQYGLRQRAIALGWPEERIVVIDGDQGQSAASAQDREGFQRLVAEVGMGRVGLVMGLEVSRLARNNSDWHRLLELCAITDTLILDEDGVYEPSQFNDRLLLGLKGAMSEAELHVLRARLRGGIENKARRGELKLPLPVGFVYDARDRVVLDPDTQVRESVSLLFRTFSRTGSATATVRHFAREELSFPRRLRSGPAKQELAWGAVTQGRVLAILRNPRYAGAFAFGKTRQRRGVEGRRLQKKLDRKDWCALIPNAHEGYIGWQQFEDHLEILRANARAAGIERRTPPREGPALLQGLILCGVCGAGMTVRYDSCAGRRSPRYLCQAQSRFAKAPCQSIPGAAIDAAVAALVLDAVTPVAIETSLAVQQEIQARIEQADRLRHRAVERASYEADLARNRFMRVDPDNRLVADALEADWNDKLRAALKARDDYERKRNADRVELDEDTRARVRALASDLPRLWSDPATAHRERKRIVRLIVEDATLIKGAAEVTVHVRFRGGATCTTTVPRALASWETWQTSPEVVALIDKLLDDHTNTEIAMILNERGLRSGGGESFHGARIKVLRRAYGLRSRDQRLKARGLLTLDELAAHLGCSANAVRERRRRGTLPVESHRVDDNGRRMFEPPTAPTDSTVERTAV